MARKILRVIGIILLTSTLLFGLFKVMFTMDQTTNIDFISIERGGEEVQVSIDEYVGYNKYFCENIYKEECYVVKGIQDKISAQEKLTESEKLIIREYEELLDNYIFDENSTDSR